MKTLKLSMLLLFVALKMVAQDIVIPTFKPLNYFQIATRVGYDKPVGFEKMPYINYNGGIMAGISLNHYWKNIGLQIDYDYIKNKTEIVGISNPFDGYISNSAGGYMGKFDLKTQTKNIDRQFIGIGPSYKYESPSRKFTAEFAVLGGIGFVKGGEAYAYGVARDSFATQLPVTYHSGYDAKKFSLKSSLRCNYFFTPNFGINAGIYYLQHFALEASNVNTFISSGTSSIYLTYYQAKIGDLSYFTNTAEKEEGVGDKSFSAPTNISYASIAPYAGFTVRFGGANASSKSRGKKSLTVIAVDKISGQKIPNVLVNIKNDKGENVLSGSTNANGETNFEKVSPNNFNINGTIAGQSLDPAYTVTTEWDKDKNVTKTIYYTKEDFVIEGKTFECNTTTPLPDVSVFIENSEDNYRKSTLTDNAGKFLLHLPSKKIYSLYGSKQGFFSQTEEVNPANFNRQKSLFIKLEICAEKIDCDKIYKLKNIHYDLDKFFIRDDAMPELNKLAGFLEQNKSINVELSSHTDSRADNAYNLTLSQNRANAAKNYLVSKGISADRIIPVGYGETRLLNKCADNVPCSEADHQLNRRTEFKILCK